LSNDDDDSSSSTENSSPRSKRSSTSRSRQVKILLSRIQIPPKFHGIVAIQNIKDWDHGDVAEKVG
jgi:hypothetical protein